MDKLKCPRCGLEGERLVFRKMDNSDMLNNFDVYRCSECGHFFAPVPAAIRTAYHRDVLRVQAL